VADGAHEHLGVEVVAQHGVAEARGLQRALGEHMVLRDGDRAVVGGLGQGGVDEVLHPGGLGGADRPEVLLGPAARAIQGVGGDDQRPVYALKGRLERGLVVVEVHPARHHTVEARELPDLAAAGDDHVVTAQGDEPPRHLTAELP
jgi:hypothetical protein